MKSKTHNKSIPHQLDIWTPEELHSGLIFYPLMSCYLEANCFISAHQPDMEQPDMIRWQAQWFDTVMHQLGFGFTQLLQDISVPKLWDSHFARKGSAQAIELVKNSSIDSFLAHNGSYLHSLGCLMARLYHHCKTLESQYGYPNGLLSEVVLGASHHEQAQKHLDKCLS